MTQEEALRTVGANVRRLRAGAEMTQAELASEVGVSQSAISQLERGSSDFTIGVIARVAEVLDQPVDLLFRPETVGNAQKKSRASA